jgi:hypothetical protein
MAAIDKTYTDSYKDYKEFKDWADTQNITFYDGLTENIGKYVWKYDEEDFASGEIPIMNSPMWLDVYIIQNCKIKFVLDRLLYVYGEKTFEEYKTIDLTAKPSGELQQNRKIIITKNKRTIFKLHNKPFNVNGKKQKWALQCFGDFWFNDDTDKWVSFSTPYPWYTNTAYVKSIKSLIRHLRKQYLPKGITFRITGRYIGEEYNILIS